MLLFEFTGSTKPSQKRVLVIEKSKNGGEKGEVGISFLKMGIKIASLNRCIECDEIITNPICSECLAERMKTVVQEHDPKLAEEITGMEIGGATECISCGKNMGLCAHCFSKDIYELVEEQNPALAREFIARFDFELRQKVVDFA